ncbi:Gfo/Idh/MocA family protein [Actinoplanes sp. CA-030573]|uniref:Gfo/Idh/MocA family protein n=1 Tax=Actinoplanes sp. CA-030573 TaxID=3239898 RepID=UPI003D8AE617
MTVRWGMLSTASIGRVVADAVQDSARAEFVAVAGRDAEKAAGYAAELGIPESYGSYEELLADDGIDAVYIPLPVALHAEWTIRALRAGKHVLCEKPLAPTAADAAACFDAADAAGRLCIEGLMWRHHPQTRLARSLLADGAIGELALIRAALTVDVPPGDIRRTAAMGGGAALDLGCYCVSAIRLFGGRPLRVAAEQVADTAPGARGLDLPGAGRAGPRGARGADVPGAGRPGPRGARGADVPGAGAVDLRLAATLALPGDVLAQFDVALDFPRRDELELIGTGGKITVRDPWLCRYGIVEVERDGTVERLSAAPPDPDENDAYRIEIEAASHAIATGAEPPFGRADAIEQAEVVEAVRLAAATGRRIELPPT